VQGKRKTTAKLLPIWGKGKRVFAARTFIPSLIHSFIHALIHLLIHGDGVGVASSDLPFRICNCRRLAEFLKGFFFQQLKAI